MKDQAIAVSVIKNTWIITGVYPPKSPYITLYCQGKAFEVINVWDYQSSPSKSTIPDDPKQAKKSVRNEIQEWIDDFGTDIDNEMENYMVHTQ